MDYSFSLYLSYSPAGCSVAALSAYRGLLRDCEIIANLRLKLYCPPPPPAATLCPETLRQMAAVGEFGPFFCVSAFIVQCKLNNITRELGPIKMQIEEDKVGIGWHFNFP